MNRVVLTREEGRWLSRNVLKTKSVFEARAKQEPQILDRTTYKTVVALEQKAKEIEDVLQAFGENEYEFELMLTQKQKTVLRDILGKTLTALEETILPEYEKRGLEDRAKGTKRKIGLLKDMGRKLR